MRRVLLALPLLVCLSAVPAAAEPDARAWPARVSLGDLARLGLIPSGPAIAPLPADPSDTPPQYAEGDTRDFWTYDLSVMPPRNVSVRSTCRAVGETVYVFVADDEWGARVSQADADAIRVAFDEQTPANPEAGITAAMLELFGPSSDIDDDPRLFILVYDIPAYEGHQFDGFFRSQAVPCPRKR